LKQKKNSNTSLQKKSSPRRKSTSPKSPGRPRRGRRYDTVRPTVPGNAPDESFGGPNWGTGGSDMRYTGYTPAEPRGLRQTGFTPAEPRGPQQRGFTAAAPALRQTSVSSRPARPAPSSQGSVVVSGTTRVHSDNGGVERFDEEGNPQP
jgi:hypothetical protein